MQSDQANSPTLPMHCSTIMPNVRDLFQISALISKRSMVDESASAPPEQGLSRKKIRQGDSRCNQSYDFPNTIDSAFPSNSPLSAFGGLQISLHPSEDPLISGIDTYGQHSSYHQGSHQGFQGSVQCKQEYQDSATPEVHDPTFELVRFDECEGAEDDESGFGTISTTPPISPPTSPRLDTSHNVGPTSGPSPQPVLDTAFMGNSNPDFDLQSFDVMHQQVPYFQGSFNLDQSQHCSLMTPILHQRSFSAGDIHSVPTNSSVTSFNRVLGGARDLGVFSQHGWPNSTSLGREPLSVDNQWRAVQRHQKHLIAQKQKRRAKAQRQHSAPQISFCSMTRHLQSLELYRQQDQVYQAPTLSFIKLSAKDMLMGTPSYDPELARRLSTQDPDAGSMFSDTQLQLPDILATTPPPAYSSASPSTCSTETVPSTPPPYSRLPSPELSPEPERVGKRRKRPATKKYCATCGKGFTRPANLRSHEDVHNGIRRHNCAKIVGDDVGCHLYFTRLTDLKRHTRSKHPGAIWPFSKRKKGDVSAIIKVEVNADEAKVLTEGAETSSEVLTAKEEKTEEE